MPVPTTKEILNNPERYQQPNLPIIPRQGVGSRFYESVNLSHLGLGESQWDKGFQMYDLRNATPEDVYEHRAQTQGKFSQYGNAMMNLWVGEIGLGTIKAIADMPDIVRVMFGEKGLASLADEDFANIVSQTFGEAKEQLGEAFPIYRTKESQGFSPGHWSWYMEHLPMAGSAVSMLIPAGALGKAAGYIPRLVKLAITGGKVSRVPKTLTAVVSSGVSATTGNFIESYQQLEQQMPELYERLKNTPKKDGTYYNEEEIRDILQDEGWRQWVGNMKNIPLDMLGWFHLFKPLGGANILSKDAWKLLGASSRQILSRSSVRNTIMAEMIPEGVQEGINFFEQEASNRNIDIKLGIKNNPYTYAEAIRDPEFWNATTWGALGSILFTGGQSMLRQISDNYNYNQDVDKFDELNRAQGEDMHKRGLLTNIGRVVVTGQTMSEAEAYIKQQEELIPLYERIDDLSKLKNIAEMSGNSKMYEDVRETLTVAHGLLHMNKGTFREFIKSNEKLENILNGQLSYLNEELEKTPENEEMKEYHGIVSQTLGHVQSSKEILARAEQDYINIHDIMGIRNRDKVNQYVEMQQQIRNTEKHITDILQNANSIYSSDEIFNYMSIENKEVVELMEQVEAIKTELAKQEEGGTARKMRRRIDKIQDKIEALREKSEREGRALSEDLNLKEQEAIAVAQHTLNLLDMKKEALALTKKEKVGIKDIIEIAAKADKKLASYMYGDDTKKGIYKRVNEEYNSERVLDMQLINDIVVHNGIKEGEDIIQLANDLYFRQAGISEAAKTQLLQAISDKVEEALGSLEELGLTSEDANAFRREALKSDDALWYAINEGRYDAETGTEIPYEDTEGIYERLKPVIGYAQAMERVKEADSKKKGLRTKDSILQDIINTELDNAKAVIDAIEQNEDNTDIGVLNSATDIINNVIGFIEHDTLYEGLKWDKINEKIDKITEKHKEVMKIVAERMLNEGKRQEEQYQIWIQDVSEGFVLAEQDKTDTIDAIHNRLMSIKNDERQLSKFATVREVAIKRFTELINTYIKAFNARSLEYGIIENIDAAIIDIINSNGNNKNSVSYQKYLLTLNLKDIRVEEFEYFNAQQKTYLKEIIESAIKAKQLQLVSGLVNSEISVKTVIEETKTWLSKNEGAPFPEQNVTIMTALMYYFNPAVRAMNLQGRGGTGKSMFVAKLISDTVRKRSGDDSVLALSEGERAAEIINESLFGKSPEARLQYRVMPDQTITLVNEDELLALFRKKKLVIIDEVGRLYSKQYNILTRLLAQAQRENPQLKVLFTGDQQQVSATMFPTLTIQKMAGYAEFAYSEQIHQLPAMILSQRTGNTEVQRLQDIFLNAGNKNVFAEQLNFGHNVKSTSGVQHVKGRKDFEVFINNRIREAKKSGKKLALITQANYVGHYNSLFNAANDRNIDIYDVKFSHGIGYDEVYVHLDYDKSGRFGYADLNRNYYQAISRAKEFVLVLSEQWKGDDSINDFSSDEEILAARKKKYDDNRKKYEKYVDDSLRAMGEEIPEQEQKEKEKEKTDITIVEEPEKDESENVDNTGEEGENISEPVEAPIIGDDEGIDLAGTEEAAVVLERFHQVNEGVRFVYSGVKLVKVGDILKSYYRKDKDGKGIHKVYIHDERHEVMTAKAAITEEEAQKQGHTIYIHGDKRFSGREVSVAEVTYTHLLSALFQKKQEHLTEAALQHNIREVEKEFGKVIQNNLVIISGAFLTANKATLGEKRTTYLREHKGDIFHVIKYKTSAGKEGYKLILLDVKRMNIHGRDVDFNGNEQEGSFAVMRNFLNLADKIKNSLGDGDIFYGNNAVIYTTDKGTEITGHDMFMSVIEKTVIDEKGDLRYTGTLEGIGDVIGLLNTNNPAKEEREAVIQDNKDFFDSLVSTEIYDKIKIKGAKKVPKSDNRYLMQGEKTRKPLGHDWSVIVGAKTTAIKEDMFKAFTIVQVNDKYKLRRTYEVEGENVVGDRVIYHVMITQGMSINEGVLDYSGKPLVEVFLLGEKDIREYDKDKLSQIIVRNRKKPGNRVFISNKYDLSPLRRDDLLNTELYDEQVIETLENGITTHKPGKVQQAFNRISKANGKIYFYPRGHKYEGQYFKTRDLEEETEEEETRKVTKEEKIAGYYKTVIINLRYDKEVPVYDKQNNKVARMPMSIALEHMFAVDEAGNSIANEKGLAEPIRLQLFNKAFNPQQRDDAKESKAIKANYEQKIENRFKTYIPTFINVAEYETESEVKPEQPDDIQVSENITAIVNSNLTKEEKLAKLWNMLDDTNGEQIDRAVSQVENMVNDEKANVESEPSEKDVEAEFIPEKVLVTDAEKEKIYQLIKRYIPDITRQEINLLSELDFADKFGKLTLGKFIDGIIYLKTGKDNTLLKKQLKHEVFHKIFWQYLTPKARQNVYWALRNSQEFYEYALKESRDVSSYTAEELEEYAARLYQDYDRINERMRSDNPFIQKIYDALNFVYDIINSLYDLFTGNKRKDIYSLFREINAGKYRRRLVPNVEIRQERDMTSILKYFPSDTVVGALDKYQKAIEFVKNKLYTYSPNNMSRPYAYLHENNYIVNYDKQYHELVHTIWNYANKERVVNKENVEDYIHDMIRGEEDNRYAAVEMLVSDLTEVSDSAMKLARKKKRQYFSEMEEVATFDEILDSVRKDYEKEISQDVKEFLSFIKYKDDSFMFGPHAFVLMTEVLGELDFNNLTAYGDIVTQIDGNMTHMSKKHYKYHIYEALRNLAVQATERFYNPYGTKEFYTFNDKIYFQGNIAIVNGRKIKRTVSTNDWYNLIVNDIINDTSLLLELIKKQGIATQEFRNLKFTDNEIITEWVKEEYKTKRKALLMNYISQVYRRDYARNMTGQLYNQVGSLVKTKPFALIEEEQGYGEDISGLIRFMAKNPASITEAYYGEFWSKFTQLVSDVRNKDGKISRVGDAKLKAFKQVHAKILHSIRLPKELTEEGKRTLYEVMFSYLDMKVDINSYTMDDLKDIAWLLDDFIRYALKDMIVRNEDFDNVYSRNRGRLRSLGEIMSRTSNLTRAQNYRNVFGDRVFINTLGSWFNDVIDGVLRRRRTSFLGKDNLITRHNIFVQDKKLNEIYDYFSVDGSYNKKYQKATGINELIDKDYFMLRFFGGFVSALNISNAEQRHQYHQFAQTQGDRKDMSGVLLNMLGHEDMKEVLKVSKAFEADRKPYYKKLGFNTDNINNVYDGTVESIIDRLNHESIEVFNTFIKEFEYGDYNQYDKLSGQIDNAYKNFKKQLDTEKVAKEILTLNKQTYENEEKLTTKDKLMVLFNIWYLNNNINGYHLDMLLLGDMHLYPTYENAVKRNRFLKTTGKKLLTGIDNAPKYSPYAIFEDPREFYDSLKDIAGAYEGLYGVKIKTTDGITFILPETVEEDIHQGTRDYSLGTQIKNVVAYIDDNGIQQYIKTSSLVLTDAIVAMFPELRKQRDIMRKAKIKHLIAMSSKKTPLYEKTVKWGEDIPADSVYQLDNRFYRIQGNPLSEKKYVSNPSQLPYWLNTNNNSRVETEAVYKQEAKIIDLQWKLFNETYKVLDEKGELNHDNLRKAVLDNLDEESNEKLYDMLHAGLSFNYPLVSRAMIIHITSMITRNVISTVHSGNKFTLAPPLGGYIYDTKDGIAGYDSLSVEDKFKADEFYNLPSYELRNALINTVSLYTWKEGDKYVDSLLKDNKDRWLSKLDKEEKKQFDEYFEKYKSGEVIIPRKLRMRDKGGYAEIIVSRDFANRYGLSTGSKVIFTGKLQEKLDTGIGVRIPTTGLHTAIAVRIVGIQERSNMMIAPEEMIQIHGSDFDVDAIFLMIRETHIKDMPEELADISKIYYEKGMPIGYTIDGIWDVEYEDYLNSLPDSRDKFKQLLKLEKNKKIDLIEQILTKEENREDMNSPITMKPIKYDIFDGLSLSEYNIWRAENTKKDDIGSFKEYFIEILQDNLSLKTVIGDYVKGNEIHFSKGELEILYEGLKKDILILPDKFIKDIMSSDVGVITMLKAIRGKTNLYEDRDKNNFLHQWLTHKENFDANKGVGIQAAMMRDFAYILFANKNKDIPVSGITFLGKKYNYIKGDKVFKLGDTVINSYLDNSEHGLVKYINATASTMNFVGFAIQEGMDIKDIALILNQPVMLEVGKYTRGTKRKIKKIKDKLKIKIGSASLLEDVTLQDMIKGLRETRTIDEIIEKGTLQELKVQYYILTDIFEKVNKTQASFHNYSKVISSLSGIPIDNTEIEKIIEAKGKVDKYIAETEKGDKITTEENITAVEHIGKAYDVLVQTKEKIINPALFKYENMVTQAVESVMEDMAITQESLEEENLTVSDEQEYIRENFESYLLSGLIEYLRRSGDIQDNNYVAVDYYGTLLTEKQAEGRKDILYLTKQEALIQDYIVKIKGVLKTDLRYENTFLKMFNASLRQSGTRKGMNVLNYNGGSSSDPNIGIDLQKGFMALDEDTKKLFRIYDLLINKAQFGFRGFGNVVPVIGDKIGEGKDQSKWDNLKYFDDLYNKIIEEVKTLPDREALFNNFKLQYLFNNGDKLKNDLTQYRVTGERFTNIMNLYFKEEEIVDIDIAYKVVLGNRKRYGEYNTGIYERVATKKLLAESKKDEAERIKSFIDSLNADELDIILDYTGQKEWNEETQEKFLKSYNLVLTEKVITNKELASIIDKYKQSLPKKKLQEYSIYRLIGRRNRMEMYEFRHEHLTMAVKPVEKIHWVMPYAIFVEIKNSKKEIAHIYSKENGITPNMPASRERTTILIGAEETGDVMAVDFERSIVENKETGKYTLTDRYYAPLFNKPQLSVEGSVRPINDIQYNELISLLQRKYGNVVSDPQEYIRMLNASMGYMVSPENYPAGFILDGVIYINTTGKGHQYGLDTPIHEVAHLYIDKIKKYNPTLYKSLKRQLKASTEGQEILSRIRLERERLEERKQTLFTEDDIIEEAMVTYIGVLGAKMLTDRATEQERSLYQKIVDFIKAFFDISKEAVTLKDIASVIISEEAVISTFKGEARQELKEFLKGISISERISKMKEWQKKNCK